MAKLVGSALLLISICCYTRCMAASIIDKDGDNSELDIYSSYRCPGQPWYMMACYSCVFRNVCYNGATRKFIYYRHPAMAQNPLMYDGMGTAFYSFPPKFSSSNLFRFPQIGFDFTPEVVHNPIPKDAVFLPHGTYILSGYSPYGGQWPSLVNGNFGHYWWEYLLPLWSTAALLDVDKQTATVLFHEDFEHKAPGTPWTRSFEDQVTTCSISWLLTMFNRPPVWLREFDQNNSSSVVCFPRVAVGNACLNLMFAVPYKIPDVHSSFPDHAYASLGIHPMRKLKPKVSVIYKVGRRVPINYDEIMTSLATLDCEVELLKDMQTMDVKTQVEKMSSTTVLISPAGGISTVSIFLPHGATSIIFGLWNTVLNNTFEYDNPMYGRFHHLNVKVFPVLFSDYERNPAFAAEFGTGNDPGQLNSIGKLAFASYWVNTTRLLHFVREEIYLWQQVKRHDQRQGVTSGHN